jgi:hypothetical protein
MSELQVTNITGATLNNFESQTADALNATGTAPMFACRAWVNFDGTRNVDDTGASTNGNPVLIRASGNVTSVVKNGTGDYTINFTTAMEDDDYAAVCTLLRVPEVFSWYANAHTPTTSSIKITTGYYTTAHGEDDVSSVNLAIFR